MGGKVGVEVRVRVRSRGYGQTYVRGGYRACNPIVIGLGVEVTVRLKVTCPIPPPHYRSRGYGQT